MPAGRMIQSPYFASGDPETEEYTALPASGSTLPPAGSLGCFAEYMRASNNFCKYQLVKSAAGVTPAVGATLYWSDKANSVVTTVRTNRGQVAGICVTTLANAASYFWMLKRGDRGVLYQAVPTSAPDATGKPVVPSSTVDGQADALASAEAAAAFPLIGVTLGATANNIASTRVNIPD